MRKIQLVAVAILLLISSFCKGASGPFSVGFAVSGEAVRTSSEYEKFIHFKGPGLWSGFKDDEKRKWDNCVYVDLTCSYRVSSFFEVETGVSYLRTHANSLRFYTSSLGSALCSNSALNLNYLSVPVYARLNFFKMANVVVFGKVGPNFSYCFSGKEVMDDLLVEQQDIPLLNNPEYVYSMTHFDVDSHPIQISLFTEIGFEYIMSDRFGVFTEFGAAYHFKDKSEVYSFFQQHTWSPVATFGIRYHFL